VQNLCHFVGLLEEAWDSINGDMPLTTARLALELDQIHAEDVGPCVSRPKASDDAAPFRQL
jgi:hypothetical protein